jgi:hypothetical protein
MSLPAEPLTEQAWKEVDGLAEITRQAGIGDRSSAGYRAVMRWWNGREGHPGDRRGLLERYRDKLALYLVRKFRDHKLGFSLIPDGHRNADMLQWVASHLDMLDPTPETGRSVARCLSKVTG